MKAGSEVWSLSVPGQVRIPQWVDTKTINLFFHQALRNFFISVTITQKTLTDKNLSVFCFGVNDKRTNFYLINIHEGEPIIR